MPICIILYERMGTVYVYIYIYICECMNVM